MEKKRVMLTLKSAPYEELHALGKKLGLKKTWFSAEIDRFIAGLIPVFQAVIDHTSNEEQMTEDAMYRAILRSVEKAQGVNLMKLKKHIR